MGNFGRNSLSGKPTENNDDGDGNDGDSIKNRTLWIGGAINQQVDEELLFEMFNNAGPIEDIRIPIDRERNQYKNFAFITYRHEESVPYAISLFDRMRLFGKDLILKHATGGGGSSHNRPSGRHHSRSISAPGMITERIVYHHNQQTMPNYIDQQQPHRQRYNNDFNPPRYPPQNNYNNYAQPKSYDDHPWQGETSSRSNHHYSRNPYSKEKRDRRYERRSHNDYDRYRRIIRSREKRILSNLLTQSRLRPPSPQGLSFDPMVSNNCSLSPTRAENTELTLTRNTGSVFGMLEQDILNLHE
ncbi:RBM7 [Lepeophtheirus salmonis]|uniref:RBM7 n=2 Tax=Lepeophtheirus salmonis TaxID=72036 RepID=A0A7R8CPK0_LEPSM|nr:RBM7 [Lepeophtheirus salmonis]CAF2887130.1 RBM7 [Lepeophtheirus salmonis]